MSETREVTIEGGGMARVAAGAKATAERIEAAVVTAGYRAQVKG